MKRLMMILLPLALLSLGTFAASAQDEPPEPPTEGVAVTVYNQGSALVQDRRTFTFEAGTGTIDFTDVAASIDSTSVSFTSLTDPQGTIVLEQNYVYDLVNSDALLRRYIDQDIQVTTEDGTNYAGQLLSGRGGDLILRQDDGQVMVVRASAVRDIRFPELPDGLITRPTLRWLVQAAQSGEQLVELTYLTGGLSWTADYIVLLGAGNQTLDLNGWVTLNNTSGTSYQDAQLKLVAGDVARLPSPTARMEVMEDEAVMAAPAEPSVAQREFFEYQLYEITRPVTVGDNETKQVEFVTGTQVPATTFYVFDASTPFYGYGRPITDRYYDTGVTNVQNYLEFSTGEDEGLDADLPAGRVRVYQEDIDGAALLIGENSIDHTPSGEQVRLYLGNAFDLVGERIQTDYRLISDNVLQETYEIRLRNRKDSETVEIRVPERLFRWSNWEILSASEDYTRLNAHTIEFRAEVEPGKEHIITYTVQYSWPRR